jgi:lipopolysaccharide/colanic/teichoic acid biosynthesis glycosyltransferase
MAFTPAAGNAPDAPDIPRWKRVLDISFIIVGLPVLAPVALVIALIIKAVSRGPVLFQQERIGLMGKSFTCFKFRTMRVNAGTTVHQGYLNSLMQSGQPMTKMDSMGDPRLIPLGSILRATGLDELPQMINVLCGEMSIVGPRPCLPYEYANYLPWQKQRFRSVPGLTGLWQVNGKNKTTFEQMIRMDISYAERKSIWLDLGIMLKTFPTIGRQLLEAVFRKKPAKDSSFSKLS